jgi:NADPH:quinone reductase-like Zn-dependent oxidoreductase
VGSRSTLLINGASGSVGSAAVQLAVVRGARVIGTASPAHHDYLRSLAPAGVDVALDVAGSGVLPDLIGLAGGQQHVVTIADSAGAKEHEVTFSSGDAGRAVHALAEIGALIDSGASPYQLRRPSRSLTSPRRTVSARTGTCAGSSCCWSADVRG